MLHPTVTLEDAELDTMAWGFIDSSYAGSQFADWPIDRRLHAYLDHRRLSSVADDGTLCEALLDRVMAKLPFALDSGETQIIVRSDHDNGAVQQTRVPPSGPAVIEQSPPTCTARRSMLARPLRR
jgi:hypothetical protein